MKNYYQLFEIKGTPIYAHYGYFFLTILAFAAVTEDLDLGIKLLSWALIQPLHEIGHLIMSRQQKTPVNYITLNLLHGQCVHLLPETEYEESVIAWGGVLMQMALIPIPLLLILIFPNSTFSFISEKFLFTNIFLIGFNLLPIPGFDGSKCWIFFPLVKKYGFKKSPKNKKEKKKKHPDHIKVIK